jgi:hypothetical protein
MPIQCIFAEKNMVSAKYLLRASDIKEMIPKLIIPPNKVSKSPPHNLALTFK